MNQALINWQEALRRIGDDEEFLVELLKELGVQLEEQLDSLKAAVMNAEYDQVSRIAHSLKGAASNLNADRFADLFLTLENMGRDKNLTQAGETLQAIDDTKQEFDRYLEQF